MNQRTAIALATIPVAAVMLLGTVARAAAAQGQQPIYDPATGNYRVTYYSDGLHRDVTMEVVPPNKIDPALSIIAVQKFSSAYEYRYELMNRVGARTQQALVDFRMPCGPPQRAAASAPAAWIPVVGGPDPAAANHYYCDFLATNTGVQPGDLVSGFAIRTGWLPAIAEIRFWGAAPPPEFEPSDVEEHDPELHQSLEKITGVMGGWLAASGLAPTRDPAVVGNSRAHLDLMIKDLAMACGGLRWIGEPVVCHNLEVNLEHARDEVARSHTRPAAEQLQAFLRELEAQHDPQPGTRVSDNAYWLLKINAEYALSSLGSERR